MKQTKINWGSKSNNKSSNNNRYHHVLFFLKISSDQKHDFFLRIRLPCKKTSWLFHNSCTGDLLLASDNIECVAFINGEGFINCLRTG